MRNNLSSTLKTTRKSWTGYPSRSLKKLDRLDRLDGQNSNTCFGFYGAGQAGQAGRAFYQHSFRIFCQKLDRLDRQKKGGVQQKTCFNSSRINDLIELDSLDTHSLGSTGEKGGTVEDKDPERIYRVFARPACPAIPFKNRANSHEADALRAGDALGILGKNYPPRHPLT
jgi:hypothetical protein